MRLTLDAAQAADLEEFRAFADAEVAPLAASHDREERIDGGLAGRLAERGYLASQVPEAYGGRALGPLSYGLLHQEVGRACTATRSLLTVHDMVAQALLDHGDAAQRDRWLPRLCDGRALGAFALSEPEVGSDAHAVRTRAERRAAGYVLTGCKRWISFGQVADVFLVFARTGEGPTAFLVGRDTPGLEIEPIQGLLGARGSMLAELRLEGCAVPGEALLDRPGRGHPAITTTTLTLGRYSVACGTVGLLQACLDAAVSYTRVREQAGALLADHQLVRRLLAGMVSSVEASRLLCLQVGDMLARRDPRAPLQAAIAKHFTAVAAGRASRDAVQVHGARGCTEAYPVERLFRDAKVLEVIEGSNEVNEVLIGKYGYTEQPTVVG